jgi:hypothetical protein
MLVGRDPISLGATARSISKARMSVKSSALVLTHGATEDFKKNIRNMNVDGYDEQTERETHSTSENR